MSDSHEKAMKDLQLRIYEQQQHEQALVLAAQKKEAEGNNNLQRSQLSMQQELSLVTLQLSSTQERLARQETDIRTQLEMELHL